MKVCGCADFSVAQESSLCVLMPRCRFILTAARHTNQPCPALSSHTSLGGRNIFLVKECQCEPCFSAQRAIHSRALLFPATLCQNPPHKYEIPHHMRLICSCAQPFATFIECPWSEAAPKCSDGVFFFFLLHKFAASVECASTL